MARNTARKNGAKIPQHRKYSKPVKPVTDADMAFVNATLGLAEAEGHVAPPAKAVRRDQPVEPVATSKRNVKPIDPGKLGRGKTTKAAALARKAGKPPVSAAVMLPTGAVMLTPEQPDGTEAPTDAGKAERCSVCGKPLSKDSSQAQGMGDICAGKHALLPAGMTMHDYKQSLSQDEVPAGWIKLQQVYAETKKQHISRGRFLRAVGGDRHLLPPTDPVFKVIYVKGVRYMSGKALKALDKMKALK